jgi:hypothetical protein
MEKKQTDVQIIAANLTAAAHVHMLWMQLRGERVTLDEAIEAVSATYRHLLANPYLFGAANLRALAKDPQQRFTDGGEWRRVF